MGKIPFAKSLKCGAEDGHVSPTFAQTAGERLLSGCRFTHLHVHVCISGVHRACVWERQTETQKSLILLCGSKKRVHLAWLAHPITAINRNGADSASASSDFVISQCGDRGLPPHVLPRTCLSAVILRSLHILTKSHHCV